MRKAAYDAMIDTAAGIQMTADGKPDAVHAARVSGALTVIAVVTGRTVDEIRRVVTTRAAELGLLARRAFERATDEYRTNDNDSNNDGDARR